LEINLSEVRRQSERTIAQRVDQGRERSLRPKSVSLQKKQMNRYWLELISEGKLLPDPKIGDLLKEANELTAIFTSARRTSSRNQTSNLKSQKS
jgi:hypothetical protein